MDDAVSQFVAVTGQSVEVATRYLEMAENDAQQAIELFFESPDLASNIAQPPPPPIPTSSRPAQRQPSTGREDASGVIHIDSDDDENFNEDDDEDAATAAALGRAADYDDDEAMARRMQEEFYAGGDSTGGFDADGVRAPIARTRETLVGGSGEDWGPDDMPAHILAQMRARAARGTAARPGIFNQRPPSIWDDDADDAARLAEATGGASSTSDKAQKLAEAFRPPFELMYRLPWDQARDKGKEDAKWLMVNVQDPNIFECQNLNRDLWKHEGIRDVVKENFLFIQYNKGEPNSMQFCQYYLPNIDSGAAFPHIAIIDPRTGEQVKVWSGSPAPKAPDFLMQLIEFLDRYSLDVTKKNPVAKRKPEKAKSLDVDRLTEQEMLDLALKNSLASGPEESPKGEDPDDLTKSFGPVDKGKGKEVTPEEALKEEATNGHDVAATPFSNVSSTNPHIEPDLAPNVTRMQFRYSKGRVVRRFNVTDPVRRIYEWLKAEPLEGYPAGAAFDLKSMGKDLTESLDQTIEEAGLKNSTVMVEYLEE